jgi:hypothetical protein
MTVRLRPHHLLCVLTYRGAGYSPAFCANFDRIAARIADREDIEICAGPDDVCAPLLSTEASHCLNESVQDRDIEAANSISELLGRSVATGIRLELDAAILERCRHAFAGDTIRAACMGCEWRQFCTDIAGDGFAGTRLLQAGNLI